MSWHEYPDTELMALYVADKLASDLRVALEHRDRALLVVPGGTTPGPIFDSLCAVDLDWDRVDVALSDERWVPEDHPRSNTKLLRARLLTSRAAAARLLPLYHDHMTAAEGAEMLSDRIEPALPVSVCLLGMGEDMHTASLFPGAVGLEEALAQDAPVLMPIEAPNVPEARVTLTARVLRAAMSLHIVITGTRKRAALEAAWSFPPEEAPVAAILPGAQVHWTH